MILTFKQDYSSSVVLDSQLMGVPDSGAYWNAGTHPLVSINNILSYLPDTSITTSLYAAGTTYAAGDLITSSSIMYESLVSSNKGHTPASSPTYWLVTNEDSQKIKRFLDQVKENVKSALKLDRKLIENQYIYHIAKSDVTPTCDYIGWAFEHKNSDYVAIRLNKLSFQANTDEEVTFSVVNNGSVIDTFLITPNDGDFEFVSTDLVFSGFGTFYLVAPAQSIKSDGEVHDPLKYNGMVCYPVEGIGATAASAEYVRCVSGNGMGFNVSAYADTSQFVLNNEIDFVEVYKWQLAYDLIQIMLFNPHTTSDRNQRNLTEYNRDILTMEAKDNILNTITTRYNKVVSEAREIISKTFDSLLRNQDKDFTIIHSTL